MTKEKTKRSNTTKQKIINFDDVKKENITESNKHWPQIPDHPYIILIIGGSRFGKTNSPIRYSTNQILTKLICLSVTDLYEAKY